ncbi:MAG TPA: hypothetical protein VK934_02180, partial [Fimbriimonas sp.]|nr:hypothetical protein [Fimbriimonas sp.]
KTWDSFRVEGGTTRWPPGTAAVAAANESWSSSSEGALLHILAISRWAATSGRPPKTTGTLYAPRKQGRFEEL